jgi:hypothetical protein
MSDAQFKEFYWPYLRKGLVALVEKGIIPVVYWEADFESRLPHIVDVPKGLAAVATLVIRFATLWFGVLVGMGTLTIMTRRLALHPSREVAPVPGAAADEAWIQEPGTPLGGPARPAGGPAARRRGA